MVSEIQRYIISRYVINCDLVRLKRVGIIIKILTEIIKSLED